MVLGWARPAVFPTLPRRLKRWHLLFSVESGIDYCVSGRYSNAKICANVQAYCVGPNAQFASAAECTSFYDGLPRVDPACLRRGDNVSHAVNHLLPI